jgi:hypothetical protein
MNINEAAIPVIAEPNCLDRVELWGVRGIEQSLWPTKIAAEIAARALFPGDHPDGRYSRIYFVRFVRED